MMKTCFPLLFVCLFGGCLYGQTDALLPAAKTKRYELGMNVYALSLRSGDYYSQYRSIWDHYVFNGIYARRYYGKNVLRASVNYMHKVIMTNNRSGQINSRTIFSRTLQLSTGYQRLLGGKRLVPYVTCDLAFDRTRELRDQLSDYGPLISSYAPEINSAFTSSMYSIVPGLGLRLHLGKGLVLNTEASAQFFYAVENDSYQTGRHEMVGIQGKPLLLSLGFMF